MKHFIILSIAGLISLMSGCGRINKMIVNPADYELDVNQPETRDMLEEISVPRYKILVMDANDDDNLGVMYFDAPFVIAIGNILNKTRAYDTAALGQAMNYSAFFGDSFSDYLLETMVNSGAFVVLDKNVENWNWMKSLINEIGSSDSGLSPLSAEMKARFVLNNAVSPDFGLIANISDVTVSVSSNSSGLHIAGFGGSVKEVTTALTGTATLHNLYTGEAVVSVSATNVVTAREASAQGFTIQSLFGRDEYFNAEWIAAEDMSKSRIQKELADCLITLVAKKLTEEHPDYLLKRFRYRSGAVQQIAINFAKKRGLTIPSNAQAVPENTKDLTISSAAMAVFGIDELNANIKLEMAPKSVE